jgi:hypothetical protein
MAGEQATYDAGRDRLAGQVVTWSGIGIALVSIAVLATAAYKQKDVDATLTTVFNTLIPLFGTWVGTVLAFYFSSKNYEAAAKATKDLVQQFGDERLKQILVKDAWIPVSAIDAITVEKGQENTQKFSEIRAKLSSKVSRVPIWNANKVVRFVIHESVIFEFLAAQAENQVNALKAAQPGQQPPAVAEPTLQDFLNYKSDGSPMHDIVSKIAWVAQTATLADAKAKMEGKPDCQDVFVTSTGSDEEAVLGWITNADLAKRARA